MRKYKEANNIHESWEEKASAEVEKQSKVSLVLHRSMQEIAAVRMRTIT